MENKEEQVFYILIKWISALSVFMIFNYLYWDRYISMFIPAGNVLTSLIIINISFILAIASIVHYKNLINPISLYATFIFFAGYSYLPISNKQNFSYNWVTETILFLTIFCFILGCLLNRRVYRLKIKNFSRRAVRVVFLLVMLAAIVVFALEIRMIGYVPILSLSSQVDVYGEMNENLIPFAHYLVLFMAMVPAIAYIFYKEEKLSKILFIITCAIGFFIIVNFLSRQIIMLLMLSLFYAYMYFNKISLAKTLYIGLGIVGMFILIGNLRQGSSELVGGINEYLKAFAHIEKDVSLLETYFTLYSSLNFSTFDRFVIDVTYFEKISLGTYSFRPVFSIMFLDRVGIVEYDPRFDGFKRLATYAIDPYLDFNILGVILINLFLGFISMNTFRSYQEKHNPQSIVNWALLSFCIIMSPFTNFYDSFFIWFAVLLNVALTNHKNSDQDDISMPGHL